MVSVSDRAVCRESSSRSIVSVSDRAVCRESSPRSVVSVSDRAVCRESSPRSVVSVSDRAVCRESSSRSVVSVSDRAVCHGAHAMVAVCCCAVHDWICIFSRHLMSAVVMTFCCYSSWAGCESNMMVSWMTSWHCRHMSKVVEKLACHQLVAFFEHLKLLPSLQSAYRKKHSTETWPLALASSATEDRVQDVCARIQVSAPDSTIYLSELCIPVATSAGRSHLRSAVKGCLVISYCRTKNYGQRSFSYSGPALWNSLPLTVRDPSISLTQFCARLKTEMFCRAYD